MSQQLYVNYASGHVRSLPLHQPAGPKPVPASHSPFPVPYTDIKHPYYSPGSCHSEAAHRKILHSTSELLSFAIHERYFTTRIINASSLISTGLLRAPRARMAGSLCNPAKTSLMSNRAHLTLIGFTSEVTHHQSHNRRLIGFVT